MAAGTRSIVVRFLGNASGLNNATGQAASRMDKFRARMAVAAAGIATGALVMGKKAVEIASDVSESQSKVATLLGASAASVEKFASTSATAFGMSKREALGAVGGMAAVLKAQGVTDKSAAKLSITYTKLAADLGSFNNASSADVQEALTASLTGEYEMLKKYGIVVNDATLAAEAQRIGMEKTGPTWTTAQKKTLSYNIIMASTAKAQGDFARTSGGLANQTKIMSARMEDLQGRIGAKLLPVVVKIAGKFNELLHWIDKNQTKAKVMAIVAGSLAAAIVTVSAVMTVLNVVMSANPFVLVGVAIAALVVGLVVLYKRFDTARYIINGAIKALTLPFLTYVNATLLGFELILKGLGHLPKWLGGGKFDTAAAAVAKLRGGIQGIRADILALPTSAANDFAGALKRITKQLQSIPKVTNVRIDVQTRNTLSEAGAAVSGGHSLAGGQVARAAGGPVLAGRSYLIGERGPEVVTFPRNGHVTPNHELAAAGGGDLTVEIHATGPTLDDIVEVKIRESNRRTATAVRAGARKVGPSWA